MPLPLKFRSPASLSLLLALIFSELVCVFNRSKSGLWGWRSDKAEAISGYTCKVSVYYIFYLFIYFFWGFIPALLQSCTNVLDGFLIIQVFSASNVHLVTKTRTEHLTDQDKKRTKKSSRTPLESFLGVAEDEDKQQGASSNGVKIL